MSHPLTANGLTSPQHLSQSSPHVPSVSPTSSNQSPITPLATDSLSSLSHKTIPRNYPSATTTLPSKPEQVPVEESTVNTIRPSGLPTTYSQPTLYLSAQAGHPDPRRTVTPTSTTLSGKGTPESDFLGYDDLKIIRTRSPDLADLHSSPGRHVPKADSPTLHLDNNPLQVVMPRTSSIDSAISNVSTHSVQKSTGDTRDLSPASVRSLIASAGNVENLVAHLLKDKNTVATQNAQLWKLVEKQRALLLGLNKDLERATKERDRYKKKLKELQHTVNTGTGAARPLDQKPIPSTGAPSRQPRNSSSPVDPDMIPRPLHSRDDPRNHSNTISADGEDVIGTSRSEAPRDPSTQAMALRKLHQAGSDQADVHQTSFGANATSPVSEKGPKVLATSRKAPPRPLNLAKPQDGLSVSYQNSAASELTSFEDEPERGRRRTREDDEREREKSAIEAEEARSRSKKDGIVASKSTSVPGVSNQPVEHMVQGPPVTSLPGLPLSPRPQHAQVLLSPTMPQSAVPGERTLAGALKSPGLPLSPRPMHNIAPFSPSQLPLSPRPPVDSSMPLSPRAPKQPLPIPTNPAAPVDPAMLQISQRRMNHNAHMTKSQTDVDRLHVHTPPTSEPPSVYQGLVVANYPSLLLPPNALPSIQVKVASSRQRSVRNSVLGVRSQEDSTLFMLSIISRSSNSELWRVEKVPSTLPLLEQQLKTRCPELPKMPDRKLFTGHSPALLDARRKAIDDYFEQLLDTQVDEQGGIMICNYLSTDLLDPDTPDSRTTAVSNDSPIHHINKAIKAGYLTKKGKNFGGWKSRFFVLESQELRYFESASGSHLGTIRLQSAQIGKPRLDEPQGDETEGQFRHAFLIQEPKRKDSGTYVRHILCAESDTERDEWVKLLIKCSEGSLGEAQSTSGKRSTSLARDEATRKEVQSSSPTPTNGSSNRASPAPELPQRNPAAAISGPLNGSVIKNTSAWGHKAPASLPQSSRDGKDKGYKMSNIFSFKRADPAPIVPLDNKPKPRILRHNGYVRPVFGLPLTEAVEFCAPFNVEVDLPAVVYRSIEYLRFRQAANEEGLFRLSGSNSSVRSLKERFNTEGDVDLVADEEYHDVHAVTSLFKSYLRELPSTILTRELHAEFMKVLEIPDVSGKVVAFNALVHRLPHINFVLVKELCHYLLEVTQSADKNKMSVRNMGIVFSPTLNIPPPVFNMFLNEFQAIFETAPEIVQQPHAGETHSQDLPAHEVRSPRQQTFSDVSTPGHEQKTMPSLPARPMEKGRTAPGGDTGSVVGTSSYESGNYVSHVQDGHRPAPHLHAHMANEASYNSINGMLAPSRKPAASQAEQQRNSALIFSSIP